MPAGWPSVRAIPTARRQSAPRCSHSRKTGSTASGGVPFFQGLDVAADGRVDLGWQAMTAIDPTTFGTGNAAIDSYYASSPAGGAAFGAAVKVTTVSSDPAASAQNNLQRQFWGDYNTLVSKDGSAWFIYTDSRNGAGCPEVDEYQEFLVDTGAIIEEEEREAGEGSAPLAPVLKVEARHTGGARARVEHADGNDALGVRER